MDLIARKKTKALKQELNVMAAEGSTHAHLNKEVIDKFSEVNNKPYYGGQPITGEGVGSSYDSGNYTCTYLYYPDGKLYKEVITGDIQREREFQYVGQGLQNEGKIRIEKITESGHTLTKTYSYSSDGKLESISAISV